VEVAPFSVTTLLAQFNMPGGAMVAVTSAGTTLLEVTEVLA
jgi:hypothetical protein